VEISYDAKLLGATLEVLAVPLIDGRPDESHAVAWNLPIRLPRLDYRIQSNSLSLGRLEFGQKLQVQLSPNDFVESIDWDWGDRKRQDGKPGQTLEHEYGFEDAGMLQVQAVVRRVDGEALPVLLSFEHHVPDFAIVNPGLVRISRDIELEVQPSSLAPYVNEVRWDFGAGQSATETDLKTSYKFLKPGVNEVRAFIGLRNGSRRELPPMMVNVAASDEVRAELEVEGGEASGTVNLRTVVAPDSDYRAIEVEVWRDGAKLHDLSGLQASYAIPPGEFGNYEHRFYARRTPTAGNPSERIELGTVRRDYRDRKPVQAIAVALGSALLFGFLSWSALLFQKPRKWQLCVSTKDPGRCTDPEEVLDGESGFAVWRLGLAALVAALLGAGVLQP
jgi:hypothetical protein